MRRHPVRFAEKPVDPRSSAVVAAKTEHGILILELECGHVARRRSGLLRPTAVVCTACPPAGGIGGNAFEDAAHHRQPPHAPSISAPSEGKSA